jgi:hypothetical protein
MHAMELEEAVGMDLHRLLECQGSHLVVSSATGFVDATASLPVDFSSVGSTAAMQACHRHLEEQMNPEEEV